MFPDKDFGCLLSCSSVALCSSHDLNSVVRTWLCHRTHVNIFVTYSIPVENSTTTECSEKLEVH